VLTWGNKLFDYADVLGGKREAAKAFTSRPGLKKLVETKGTQGLTGCGISVFLRDR